MLKILTLHRPVGLISEFCQKCLPKAHFLPKRQAGCLLGWGRLVESDRGGSRRPSQSVGYVGSVRLVELVGLVGWRSSPLNLSRWSCRSSRIGLVGSAWLDWSGWSAGVESDRVGQLELVGGLVGL